MTWVRHRRPGDGRGVTPMRPSRGRARVVAVAGLAGVVLGPLLSGIGVAGTATAGAAAIPPPRSSGLLRIAGVPQAGRAVTAAGLAWHAPRLPAGMRLLSFEVGYTWRSCAPGGARCRAGQDTLATPFAARRYVPGPADAGRVLRVTETATEVVQTRAATFSFTAVRRSASHLGATLVRAWPRHQPPASAFVNGTPEHRTASAEEYFQVSVARSNPADGRARQWFRIDRGRWRPMPGRRVFYTGTLHPGPHRVAVRTAGRAGATVISFAWQVVPLPAPLPCQPAAGRACWYPPHLAASRRPMRWDWQIGRVSPLERTGRRAVDIYDVDGFLTTAAQVRAITRRWPAATLAHPKAVCYLDLAWEDYRPDASPGPAGRSYFPAATLGQVYYGYPQERWTDFRQLSALAPMLRERIARCARKGFSAVELDDIDSFDPPSQTGFWLTPGDAQNFLAWAFNEVHRYGMTAAWKNSPWLSWWGRRYTDGAVVEECYLDHGCLAAQLRGSRQYGITCTGLRGATPCGWDDFSTDVTAQQPTGKWVGEAEYSADHYVCSPGQHCTGPAAFAAFCRAVWAPPGGFAAVKFDVDLDGAMFYPCPRGS
jgi:Glycoside-hydrolase family GH114